MTNLRLKKKNKDLNIRLDTIKFLEENIHWTLSDVSHSNIFFDPTLKSNESKKAYFYLFVYFLMYSMLSIVDLQEYLKRVDFHLAFVQYSGICQSG